MDAHLASAGRFELDDAPRIGGRQRCDEFYKSRLVSSSGPPTVSGHQEPLQLPAVQVQLLRGPIHSLPTSNLDRH
jgi:hypothetical protein